MTDPFSIETWRNIFVKHGQKFGWGLAFVVGGPMVVGFGLSQYTGGSNKAAAIQSQESKIGVVNGVPLTQGQYIMAMRSVRQSAQPGEQSAYAQGAALHQLVFGVVLEDEAKQQNVRPSEADIDRIMAQEREKLGKNPSDAEWESYVEQMHGGMSAAEYREALGKEPNLLYMAMLTKFQEAEKVTDDEAKNQSAQVKLAVVLIPSGKQGSLPIPGAKQIKPLPDADAKKKAEDLLAQVKSGTDIAKIAKANSSDVSAKRGGDLDWRSEFRESPVFGSIGYGKEFDAAVRKAAKGQLTEVIKIPEEVQQSGYIFAKVLDRKNDLPKDFDVKKVAKDLQQQRALPKLNDILKAKIKAAKVEISDQEKKPFYDLVKWKQMEAQKGNQASAKDKDIPTDADIDKQKQLVLTGFEAYLKKHADDATAALVVAGILSPQRNDVKITPAQKDEIEKRLMSLYVVALKSTEDRNIRFELADLYRTKKQTKEAEAQYKKISDLMDVDTPYDQQTYQKAWQGRQQIATSYKSINLLDEAKKQETASQEMLKQMIAENQKQREEAIKAQIAGKGAGSLTPPGGLTVPSGGKSSKSINLPTGTKGTTDKTESKPTDTKPDAGKPDAGKPGTGK